MTEIYLLCHACSYREGVEDGNGRAGGPACAQLRVVEQSNGDACGYHSLHNAITIGRALCAASSEAAQGWLDDLCSRRAFEAEMATMQARLRGRTAQV